jgi:hypothetical protein
VRFTPRANRIRPGGRLRSFLRHVYPH